MTAIRASLVLISLMFTASGQSVPRQIQSRNNPCPMRSTELAAINGLKLDMHYNEVLRLFPGMASDDRLQKERRERYDAVYLTEYSESSQPQFLGIHFSKDQVAHISAYYEGEMWRHRDPLVHHLSSMLSTDVDLWSKSDWYIELKCVDFVIYVSHGNPHVQKANKVVIGLHKLAQ